MKNSASPRTFTEFEREPATPLEAEHKSLSSTVDREKRDNEICQLYLEERISLRELGRRVNLSQEQVRYILRKHDIDTSSLSDEDNKRDLFLGVNITRDVKDAIRQEAIRRGLSMSELTSETMTDMLQVRGQLKDDDQPNVNVDVDVDATLLSGDAK